MGMFFAGVFGQRCSSSLHAVRTYLLLHGMFPGFEVVSYLQTENRQSNEDVYVIINFCWIPQNVLPIC